MTFELLQLPRDILQLIVNYLDNYCDKRNYTISCKKVYNSIPPQQRKKYLLNLSDLFYNYKETSTRKLGKGPKFCDHCRTYYKNRKKHSICSGLKQCFRCWGMYSPMTHKECSRICTYNTKK